MTVARNAFDPRVPLMLVLSVATGLVDAISVLGLGRVFTANMTGNVVFLGFAAAGTPGFHGVSYLVAIVAFLLGALVAGRIGKTLANTSLWRWLMIGAMVEAGLLWIAASVAIGFDMTSQTSNVQLYAIIALTAVAMGFRNATVRLLKVPDLTTTVLTLTLTGLAADSTLAHGTNPNLGRRISAVVAIFVGALIGALMLSRWGLPLSLTVAGALVLVGTIACALHPFAAKPAGA